MSTGHAREASRPSRAAQKLIVLGIMAWGEKVEVPRSRRAHARRHFASIVAKASKLGFQEAARLKAGLRAGHATPKVIERAEAICCLVSEVAIDVELRAAAQHERQVGVFGASKRLARRSK